MSLSKENEPRIICLQKWPTFSGYGFNLHSEKGKQGQFVGSVDEKSPAEVSGLKAGDILIEVNGVNIGIENHQQVVARIRENPEEVELLVVSPEGFAYYKSKDIAINNDMVSITTRCPHTSPYVSGMHPESPSAQKEVSFQSDNERDFSNGQGVQKIDHHHFVNDKIDGGPQDSYKSDNQSFESDNVNAEVLNTDSNGDGLNLNLTAAELRARLGPNKRRENMTANKSFENKAKYFQQL